MVRQLPETMMPRSTPVLKRLAQTMFRPVASRGRNGPSGSMFSCRPPPRGLRGEGDLGLRVRLPQCMGSSIADQRKVERKSKQQLARIKPVVGSDWRWSTRAACILRCNSVLDWPQLRHTSVEEAVRSSRLVRFETFEVDLPTGELRKAG